MRCLVLAAVITLSCHSASASTARTEEPVSLNFANADIEAVIQAIGRITGRNFLIDPRVRGTLNIITNSPVSSDLSYQILLSALRLQGFTAVEADGITKIIPEADAKQHGVPFSSSGRIGTGDGLVTQVFALQHESATQMMAVVRPLVAPNNTVTAFPSNNTLVVTDYASNIDRIAQIIASIDMPQGDVTVLQLEHAIAADLAVTLNRLMNDTASGAQAASEPSQRVHILPETRTNTLLIRSDNPARIRAVRQLVASLDKIGAGGNMHVVYLRNARAAQVAETLNAALSHDVDPQSSAIDPVQAGGSGKAMVQADEVNNALVIVAPDAIYRNLRRVIDQIDRRRAQVFIEALIAEVSSERAAEFGIQWQSTRLGDSGTAVLGGTNFGGIGQNIINASGNIGSVGKGLNLMIGRGTVQIPINGQMVDVFNLAALARFLETDSRTNILSTPTLITLDNEEARIVVGRNLPFVTGQYTNTGGGSAPENPFQTIERRDVGLTLQVRPQISEGGSIKLEIFQEASSVLPTVDESRGPTTNTRSIQSSVLVDDGAIIALGGLVEDSFSAGEEKVPILGDLPVAGNLFRYRNRQRTKTNLIVFLRPVILRDQDSYTELTQSRYDYVIGQQAEITGSVSLMRNEPAPPSLPTTVLREGEAIPLQAPAPVFEARIQRVTLDP